MASKGKGKHGQQKLGSEADNGPDGDYYLDGDHEERQHFLEVCWSFMEYRRDALHDIKRFQESLRILDSNDMLLWQVDPSEWVEEVRWRVEANAALLCNFPVPDVCAADLGSNAFDLVKQVPPTHRVASRNSSKVRSTLRQFVRDWAAEGKAERMASYNPLIQALLRRMPPRGRENSTVCGQGKNGTPRVLCPGCGLGRLPFDLAHMGYDAQGNEFSYHMLLGSHLILNRCPAANVVSIYPYISSTGNRKNKVDHLREIKIPEICPRDLLRKGAVLSMAAGEFVEVYKDQQGEWDAILTAFFLDTAKNIFLYIRTIASLIREGGLWINLGPLLFHFADVENDISIELSWEEVKPAILKYFTLDEESRQLAKYTTNPASMMGLKYNCIFFVATRNSSPVVGVSAPVFV